MSCREQTAASNKAGTVFFGKRILAIAPSDSQGQRLVALITNITNAAISTPAVASLGDSRFVVVWQDVNGVDLKARFITAQGEVDGPEFQINTTPGATRPAVMQRSDRGNPEFTVAWNNKDTRKVLLQRFRDRAKVGGEIVVSSTEVRVEDTPVIARLSNRIVVAWATAGTGLQGLRASFFQLDGTKVTEVRIDAGNPVNMGPIAGAALENGTFAIVWHGGDRVPASPHLQILRSDGTRIGPEKTPNIHPGQLAMSWLLPFVVPDERGAFVVVCQEPYVDDFNRTRTLLITKLFAADGTDFFKWTVTDRKRTAGQPVVAAMQGRYIVAWTERFLAHIGDRTEDNVKAQEFREPINDPEHDAPGPVMSIGPNLGNQDQPAIAVVFTGNDANVAVAWIDDSVLGPGANRRSVQATTLRL